MEYALIEFSSKELDIVHVSKLRGYRVDAKKPFECICEWKVKGKSKSRSYNVKVLHDASTHFSMCHASWTRVRASRPGYNSVVEFKHLRSNASSGKSAIFR